MTRTHSHSLKDEKMKKKKKDEKERFLVDGHVQLLIFPERVTEL